MINLLPTELKEEYRYARQNHRLAHWVLAFVFAIVGVAAITGTGLFTMNSSVSDYHSRIAATNDELSRQHYADVQKQVTQISNNLKLMVKVLGKEVLFSKLLDRLGAITPPGVILTGLTITQDQKAIDVTAQSTSYNAATQLQANMAATDNQVFDKADIVSITCGGSSSSAANPHYPCTATIRALFTTDNPFLFINSKRQTP